MHRITCTVFFEDPFWVGVWERSSDNAYACAKCTFGAEPSDAEVLSFLLNSYTDLMFSEPSVETSRPPSASNPKRAQRLAARAVRQVGIGTKAQQALKSQYEANKQEHRALSREQRLMQEERKFQLKQEKRKAKHRGH